jgi:Xaa-Pro aminopeptidase
MQPIFSDREMEQRISKLRKVMQKEGIDCVIATSYVNSYYLSGAPIHPFGRPMATLIPLDGKAMIIQSIIEKEHTVLQSWIKDIRNYWDFNLKPDYDKIMTPYESITILLRDAIKELNLENSCIGLEMGDLSVNFFHMITKTMPAVKFVDITGILEKLRSIKSAEELKLIKEADKMADFGQKRMFELLRPGATPDQLCQQVENEMIKEIVCQYPNYPFNIHVTSGLESVNKGAGHSEWKCWDMNKKVERGQVLETVISVWFWGYWGNVERTISIGKPPIEVLEPFKVMVEAHNKAIESIKPGVNVREVDKAAKAVFKRYGYTTRSGTGCGRGIISYEGNARELRLDLRLYSNVILEPGMALSIEPDLFIPDIGVFRHCNTVIVTEYGNEVDSSLPRDVIWV